MFMIGESKGWWLKLGEFISLLACLFVCLAVFSVELCFLTRPENEVNTIYRAGEGWYTGTPAYTKILNK